jgi:flagellar biogenesis protein FliO
MTTLTFSAPLAFLGTAPLRAGTDGGPDLTRYLAVCAILLLSIGGLAYLFKRVFAGAVRSRAAKRSLQVVDMLPLGGKQRVCVVRLYDRTFALGLGDKEIEMIAELDAVIAPPAVAPTRADQASFAELLKRVQKNMATTSPVTRAPARATAGAPLNALNSTASTTASTTQGTFG